MNADLNELKEFVASLKGERQAQKEKEHRDSWTRYVSISLVFLAVLTGIASQRGAGYSSATLKQLNDATYNQANASDQWSFYQAKSIKQNLYEVERERLQAEPAADAKIAQSFSEKIDHYESDKAEIAKKAKAFEEARDTARAVATRAAERSRVMGLAVTLFQVAIALGGICLVVKKRWLWWSSLGVGAAACFFLAEALQMTM